MAAYFWRMRPSQFRRLPMDEQAELIAAYRVKHQIEAVLMQKQIPPATPKPKTGSKRKGR